ncbi:MAG: hypothetical protein ACTHJ8_07475, partial [Mucilaginibacter sp.]
MPKLVKSKSGTEPEPGNKVIIQRNFTLFGGLIVVIMLVGYLASAIYPSRLFSEARDNELATQFSVHPAVPDSPLKTETNEKFA